MKTQKVWLVTGASKGLGLSLVKKLLSDGYRVAATSRSLQGLEKALGGHAGLLPLEVDLLSEESVGNAIDKTVAQWGAIDVVVNNAGYGQLGTLEELSDKEARANFDTNVFGALNVIRKATPYLRRQQSGIVINIASIGGLTGDFPGWGIYCATKFAMVGFTESYAAEVKEFGVKATVVYPGYFRTNFLSGGSLNTPANEIDAYSVARKIQAAHEQEIDGNQPGDPDKAAVALIELAEMENPPVHLLLGSDAFELAGKTLKALGEEIAQHENISRSTDF